MEMFLGILSPVCFALAAACAVACVIVFFRLDVRDAIRYIQHKPVRRSGEEGKAHARRLTPHWGKKAEKDAVRMEGADVADMGESRTSALGDDPESPTSALGYDPESLTSALVDDPESPTSALGEDTESPTSPISPAHPAVADDSESPTVAMEQDSEAPTSALNLESEAPTQMLPRPVGDGAASGFEIRQHELTVNTDEVI